jgi:signal transduction histidine kinase
MAARARAAASIVKAKIELDRALTEIDTIEGFNPALIGLVAHALSNYITVTAATVDLLQLALRGHQDGKVAIWLDGIGRTTDMMQHSVGRLVSMSPTADFPLKLDRVNLTVLLERICEYYRRRAGAADAHITCKAVGRVPPVWGDRVALAVVADNLLSHAVRVSAPRGTVRVQITAEPGHVVCGIRDAGPGLTPEEQKHILDPPLRPTPSHDTEPQADFGLGIASDFIRRMDGDLWCESEPGRGTCFSFRLPAVEWT